MVDAALTPKDVDGLLLAPTFAGAPHHRVVDGGRLPHRSPHLLRPRGPRRRHRGGHGVARARPRSTPAGVKQCCAFSPKHPTADPARVPRVGKACRAPNGTARTVRWARTPGTPSRRCATRSSTAPPTSSGPRSPSISARTRAPTRRRCFHGKPITIDDVLASPLGRAIRLHLLEIVMPCSGATAFVVTRATSPAASPHPPVRAARLRRADHALHPRVPPRRHPDRDRRLRGDGLRDGRRRPGRHGSC